MEDKNLSIVLRVAAQNLDALRQVGKDLDATSEDVQALDKQAAELQDTLAKLGAQKDAADAFKRLKRDTDDAAKALEDATKTVEKLGNKLPGAAEAAKQLADAEKAAGQAVAQARGDLEAKQGALAKLREEYTGAARKTAEFKDAETQLTTAIKAAKGDLADKQKALKDSSAAAAEAQRTEKALTQEYDKAVGSAAKLSTELGNRRTALDNSRTSMMALGLETTNLAETERQLADAVKAAKDQVAELGPAYQRLAAQQRDMKTVGVESHAAIAKQVAETRAAFERLKASGQLTGAELAQAALKAELRVRELNAQTGSLAETLDRAKGAVVGLAAAGAGLTVVSKAAIDFESAMADVRKVVEGTEEQITDLGSELKRLSSEEIPITAEGLAKIAAAGGQIGVPIERIAEFTRLAAQMATAFDMSAEEAGAAVAKLGNNFKLPIEGVRSLGDAINVLGNTTAAKEKDIIEVLTRVGGAATQFGLTAQQTAALASTMLSLGTSSEVVATGLNAMLSKLQTAAEGSKDFREGLASIGIDARKLARDVREHPQQALIEFLGTLEQLDQQTRSEILVKLFGLDYQDDIARLIGSFGQYRDNLAKVTDETRTAGSMQKEFAQRAETTANQLQLLENSVKALAINVGSVFLPVIRPAVEGLRDVAGAAAQFAEENPKITALIATIGTALATVGSLRLAMLAANPAGTLAFGNLATMGGALLKPLGEAAGAVGKLQTAFGVLSAGLVGFEIGKWASDNFEEVRQAGVALVQAVFTMAEQIQYRWEQLRTVFTDDTLEQAEARHKERAAEMARIFGELAEEATDAARAQRKGAEDAAKATEQAGRQIEKASDAAAAAVAGVGSAAQDAGKQVVAAAPPAAAAVNKVGEAFGQVAVSAAAAGTASQQAMGQVQQAASGMRVSITDVTKAATDLGVNLAPLGNQVGEGARKAQDDFNRLIGGMGALKAQGIDTGAVVRQAIAGMIARTETQADINAVRDSLTEMARQQQITGADYALALGLMRERQEALTDAIDEATPGLQSLRETAKAAGVDFDRLTTGVNTGFRKGVETVEDLIRQVDASGVSADKASPILAQALNKQAEAAQTKEEVQLLERAIQLARDTGVNFGTALDESLKKARERAKGLATDYAAIFADQARYQKALTDSKLYDLGVTNGAIGTLGLTQAQVNARNDAITGSISSGTDALLKTRPIESGFGKPGSADPNGRITGTYQIGQLQPPTNDGMWEYDSVRRMWMRTPAGKAADAAAGAKTQAANNSAIDTAFTNAGIDQWGAFGAGGRPLYGSRLPAAVQQQLTWSGGSVSLRPAEPAQPQQQPQPQPAVQPTAAGNTSDLAQRLDALIDSLQDSPRLLGAYKVDLTGLDGRVQTVRVADDASVRNLLAALALEQARANAGG